MAGPDHRAHVEEPCTGMGCSVRVPKRPPKSQVRLFSRCTRQSELCGMRRASVRNRCDCISLWICNICTDRSDFLCHGKAATMWRVRLQFSDIRTVRYGYRKVLSVEFVGLAKRSRDGNVQVMPFTIINIGRPRRYASLVYLSMMLVICERLHASLEMVARRLAPPGVVPVVPALERCEVLLVYNPLRHSFSWLGHLYCIALFMRTISHLVAVPSKRRVSASGRKGSEAFFQILC